MLIRYPPRFVWCDRQCYYLSPQGVKLPSISAILNATKPAKEWATLKAWRNRVGEREAQKITQASIARGKALHQRIEWYLQRRPLPPCPETLVPWRNSLQPILINLKQVQLVEGAVFHHELGYGGTVDAIAGVEEGEGWLWDWKTATSAKREEYLVTYKLQVAALWGAVIETYGVRLAKAVVAIALPDEVVQFCKGYREMRPSLTRRLNLKLCIVVMNEIPNRTHMILDAFGERQGLPH
jgi:genome maintenance exonuclease 1